MGYGRAATIRRLLTLLGVLAAIFLLGVVAAAMNASSQNAVRYLVYGTWLMLGLAVAYVIRSWRKLSQVYGERRMTVGAIALASVAVVLVFTVSRRPVDLTPETLAVLDSLDSTLGITVFDNRSMLPLWQPRMNELRAASDKITVSYADPQMEPALAKEYAIQTAGVGLRYKDRRSALADVYEEDFRKAVLEISAGVTKAIQFTAGHDENALDSAANNGLSQLAARLGNAGYAVSTVGSQDPGLDSRVVVAVAGPRRDFSPNEIRALRTHIANGGCLLLLIDPPETLIASRLGNLLAFANEWGFSVGDDVVIQQPAVFKSPLVTVATEYPAAPAMGLKSATAYPVARSVLPVASRASGQTPRTIIATGATTWAETDLPRLYKSQSAEISGDDTKGPVSIAAAVETSAGGRIIVIGDADFASNNALGFQSNGELFDRVMAWLRPAPPAPPAPPPGAGQAKQIFDSTRFALVRGGLSLLLGGLGLALMRRTTPAGRFPVRAGTRLNAG